MTCFRSLILMASAACLFGQTPPTPPPDAPPAMPNIQLSVEEEKLPDVPPDLVVLTVGNTKITAAQFAQLVDSLQPQYRNAARGPGRKRFGENLVELFSLAQEGERRKLDANADFKTRLMFQNANLLASLLVDELSKDVQVPEADVRQYFTEHKAEFEQVHARHILIRFQGSPVPVRPGQKDLTEAEALAKTLELRQKVQGGLDFGELAKVESDDVSSGANGGDLGSFKPGQMVPSFEEAAFAMKAGELSQPVKSQFGYHLIKVESHDTKAFEDVRKELEGKIKPEQTQKAITKAIEDLEKSHPAVFNPAFFPADKSPDKAPDKK